MNKALRAILLFLINKRYIGGKHFPEEVIIKSRIKWLQKQEIREFNKEYRKIKPFLIRVKKRTGKSSSWHISINPKCLFKIKELLDLELNE